MSGNKNFDSFYESIIKWNSDHGNSDIREKYSYDLRNENDRRFNDMSQKEYEIMKMLEGEVVLRLEAAVEGKVRKDSLEATEIAELHRKWLMYLWDSYSPQAHLDLVEKYTKDEWYKSYYDSNVEGCAEFLQSAVEIYIAKEYAKKPELELNKQ